MKNELLDTKLLIVLVVWLLSFVAFISFAMLRQWELVQIIGLPFGTSTGIAFMDLTRSLN